MAKKEKKEINRDLFVQSGKKGGEQTLKRHGTAHFVSISSKGVAGKKLPDAAPASGAAEKKGKKN